MRYRIVVVLGVCLAGGCGGSAVPNPTRPTGGGDDVPAGYLRMLSLGDSYTIGEGVPEADRWPVRLAGMLREKGITIQPRIIAKTGWTTDELSAAIDAAGPSGPYDLVTLLIGVNNQYRGRPVEDYRPQFVALLKRAVEFAGGRADRVIVVSIPDYGVTPFAKKMGRDAATTAKELDAFNAAAQEEAKKAGARFVEITAASRVQAADPAMLAADGLHPSGAMYKTWAAAVLPEAVAALGTKKE
jgi:lysophospholipase L1-like esterase